MWILWKGYASGVSFLAFFPESGYTTQEKAERLVGLVIYHILAVGDVVGEQGLDHLCRHLRALKRLKDIHFTVVNGENAAGMGILPDR